MPPTTPSTATAMVSGRRLPLILLVLACLFCPVEHALAQTWRLSPDDDSWELTEELDPSTPQGQLAEARSSLAADQPERAEKLASQWIDRYPQHPLAAEAYLLRGDSLSARRRYYEALFEYEIVIRSFPSSEAFVVALSRELEIAKMFARGLKRRLWGMRIVGAKDEAEEIFIRVQERLPGSELAEEGGMELADYYKRESDMTLAVEAYALFIENYPRSPRIARARVELIYAHLASFKGPDFDPTGLYEARTRLRELKVIDPVNAERIGADGMLARIDESDAQKMLSTARWYYRTGDYIGAEFSIRQLVNTYPRSVAATRAMRLMDDILPRLPRSIIDEAPDYAALREAILGPSRDEQPSDDENRASSSESENPA